MTSNFLGKIANLLVLLRYLHCSFNQGINSLFLGHVIYTTFLRHFQVKSAIDSCILIGLRYIELKFLVYI